MRVLTLGALSKDNTEFWLPSMEGNGLFLLDLKKSDCARYVGSFEDCEKDGAWKICAVLSWNGKICFFSRNSYEMWEMDEKEYKLTHYTYFDQAANLINKVYLDGDIAWIFPNALDYPVLKYNLKSRECEPFKLNIPTELKESAITMVVRQNENIYFATREEDKICLCSINCRTGENVFYLIGGLSFVNCIEVDGEYVYILGRNKKGNTALSKYRLGSLEVRDEMVLHSAMQLPAGRALYYIRMVVAESRVFLIPCLAEKIVVCDLESKTERVLDYPNQFCYSNKTKHQEMFFEIQQECKEVYLFPHNAASILKLYLDTSSLECIDFVCDKYQYDKMLDKMLQGGEVVCENEKLMLGNFIRCLDSQNAERYHEKNICGSTIYSKLKLWGTEHEG